MLNEIEDLLISSDIGVSTASLIVEKIKKENFSKEYAGAVSLFVNDMCNNSSFKKN